ncbi:MAG: glycosyltransferase family 39 protein [bacterium]
MKNARHPGFRAGGNGCAAWLVLSLLPVLILAGAFFRFYGLSAQSYWMDEGYTINAVLSVKEHGSTVLDSGKQYSCPTYCYPTAVIAQEFGDGPFSYRLLAAIAGTAFILVAYLAGAGMFGRFAGLAAAAFTALSYFQIAWSRQARWYTLFELFFWLALLCFYRFLYAGGSRASRVMYGAATFVLSALAILTHGLGWLLPGIFIAWFLVDRWILRKLFRLREAGFAALALACAGAVGCAFAPASLAGLMSHISFHYELPYYLSFYLRSYWPLLLLALVALARTREDRRGVWLLLFALLAYLLPLGFLTGIVHYRYLFHLTPVIFILAALGTSDLISLARPRWQKISIGLLVVLAFFASGTGVWKPESLYFLESDDPAALAARPYYAYTPQPDWTGAYAYIKSHRVPGDAIVSSLPQFTKIFLGEPGYWVRYDYLGFDDPAAVSPDGRESYVGARVLDGLAPLQALTSSSRGYLVLDTLALSPGRLPEEETAYIREHFTEVFYSKTNSYSEIWVYRF